MLKEILIYTKMTLRTNVFSLVRKGRKEEHQTSAPIGCDGGGGKKKHRVENFSTAEGRAKRKMAERDKASQKYSIIKGTKNVIGTKL